MNHLAHALLSGDDPDVMLGGLMGDFVRGAIDERLAPAVRRGIALHRAIDVYTDAHPGVASTRALFEPPFRRYAGILIDVWFDHLLARSFERWSDTPLAPFSAQVVGVLDRHRSDLPEPLQRFTRYLHRYALPAAYADRAMIAEVLAGIGSRLTRANPLGAGMCEITRLERELERSFEAFFPQLVGHAASLREAPARAAK